MVEKHSAELIQSIAVAITKEVTEQELDATISIRPTMEESLMLD